MIQQNLGFADVAPDRVSFADAANELGVSVASIRNWVKTGYLALAGKGVTRQSLDAFMREIVGNEKLNKRANKLKLDSHDHGELVHTTIARLSDPNISGNEHSFAYEQSLSLSHRNREGVFYTPQEIAGKFFETLPEDRSELVFCDPCCGTGSFLLSAIECGFSPENVFGFDVDHTAIEITRHRIFERTQSKAAKLHCLDFLETSAKGDPCFPEFDVIFTNPPWGKKLPKSEKDHWSKRFGTARSRDTCSLMMAAAIEQVKANGFLGMLLPEAFFNVAAFADIREKVLQYKIVELTDFGKPFAGLITKAKGIVIQKQEMTQSHRVRCKTGSQSTHRNQESFLKSPLKRIVFSVSQEDVDVIEYLYSREHCTLDGKAKWGLGIVTGNNKKFIASIPEPNSIPVWKGSEINLNGLESASHFIPADLSLYQQVAKRELFEADDKLLYRFISSRLVFFHDTEQRFVLNSVNFVVPNEDFPVPYFVLAQFLSGKLMNWMFQSLFDTHKVLRTDLQTLPIFHEFLSKCEDYDEALLLDYLNLTVTEDGTFRIKE